MLPELRRATFAEVLHVGLAAEVQASGGTGFDAGRLQPRAYAIRTQRTLVDLLRFGVELWNVERTTGDAVLAADAVVLIEIDDAIRILHDCAVCRAGAQTSWIGAMHAAVLAHQPAQRSIFGDMLVEADQVVVIPRQVRHGLVGIIENGLAERIAVPFQA